MEKVSFKNRLWLPFCLLVTATLLGCIAFFSSANALVTAYKLSLLMVGAVAGYFIDRVFFFFAQPLRFIEVISGDPTLYRIKDGMELLFAVMVIRQAALIIFGMLVAGMGL